MKKLLFLVVFLTGCSAYDTFYPNELPIAETLCADHEGVKWVRVHDRDARFPESPGKTRVRLTAYCKNNVEIRWQGEL